MKTKVKKSSLPLLTLTFILTILAQAAPAATDVFADKMPKLPIYNGFNQTCPAGQVQTGYYNGQPQCVNYNMVCAAGQSMKGIDASTGSPKCVATSAPCPDGYVMVGTQCQLLDSIQTDANCPTGQVLQSVSNGSGVCVVLPGGSGGGGGYYTQVASNAANAYNGSNNTSATQNVYAYSYCKNAASGSSIWGNVDGMVVAVQENPNPSGANINSIAFAVPPGGGYGVNAYCLTGGYVNVYTYSAQ